jgi:ABC exporter DevB family membrane fusion protein
MNRKLKRTGLGVLASSIALATAWSVPLWIAPGVPSRGYSAPAPTIETSVIAANGRVEPISGEVAVGTQVLGALLDVPVKEGDKVTAGQLIAETVNADLVATVARADATVDERRAELDKLLHGARPEERQRAAAEFADMSAQLSLAEGDVRRQRPLAEHRVIATADYDHSAWTMASLRARQQAANETLTLINAPPRVEDVAIARASLDIATADAATARATLEKTRIRAPIDGTVLRLLRKTGEPVGIYPPTVVALLGDIQRLRVIAEVEESDVARVHVGQTAYVTADAYMGQRFPGVVTRLADRMGRKDLYSDDPAQHMDAKVLEVTVALDQDVHLPVGLRVDVFIQDQRPAS